jgi:hypothetical protein
MPTLVLLLALVAGAPPAADEPFQIKDNSFLVEEAFNQERGIFQNILTFTRLAGDWNLTFTQEWPAPGVRHQLSYTIPYESVTPGGRGVGDVLINYRYQAIDEAHARPAFSPRISLVVPSGRGRRGAGLQVNLPFSKQGNNWYLHWNAGVTWVPHARLVSPAIAASGIYRMRQMINLMIESVLTSQQMAVGSGLTRRQTTFTLAPGVRAGRNLGRRQLVGGVAVPIAWTDDTCAAGVLGYVSYELPFRR